MYFFKPPLQIMVPAMYFLFALELAESVYATHIGFSLHQFTSLGVEVSYISHGLLRVHLNPAM
jgi:hypothetical protein